MTKGKEVLFRLKTESEEEGGLHRLGYIYRDKEDKNKWWVMGFEDSWWALRWYPRTKRWYTAMKFTRGKPGGETRMCAQDFDELTRYAEGLMKMDGWTFIVPSRTRKAFLSAEYWLEKAISHTAPKGITEYLDKLNKDYAAHLLREGPQ